jgi:hypothetical protein
MVGERRSVEQVVGCMRTENMSKVTKFLKIGNDETEQVESGIDG